MALAFSAVVVSAGNGSTWLRETEVPEETPVADDLGLDDWTIMVYIAGDNNLEINALDDLDEMELVGSSDTVNIIVLMDTLTLVEGTHWYVIEAAADEIDHIDLEAGVNDCDCEAVAGACPDGDLNMGDGETLKDFIVKSAAYAPAEQYMLVLWDHGGGWYGVCWDDSSVREEDGRIDRLTVDEFGNAIRAAEEEAGIWFTVIGFDACLMSMLEIAYEIRDLADYMISSVTGIPVAGWPYDLSFDELIADSSLDALTLSDEIIEGYIEYYSLCAGEGLGGWMGVTLNLIDLSVIGDLAMAMDALSYDLQEAFESGEVSRGALLSIASSLTPALEMYGQSFAFSDIGVLAEGLANFEAFEESATAVSELMPAAVPMVEWVSQTTGGAFNTTGLTVYFPAAYYYTYMDYAYETEEEAAENDELIYFGLDFATDTNWDEFVLYTCPAVVEE
ncbi:MAG: clostripain-related cysteine peptidase [Candidatus Thermoplasmatota archaeon]